MGTLALKDRNFKYRWASDVLFDGIRLEILTDDGDIFFDVSVPENAPVTVDAFGKMRMRS